MATARPVAELAPEFSAEDATAAAWDEGRRASSKTRLSWITTVRPDGRPHVTPLITVWIDGALYFCTGPDERKGRNLAENPHVVLTTGCNSYDEGLDVIVEGDAARVRDEATLQRIADAYVAKYGEDWRFGVRDEAFYDPKAAETHLAYVFEVAPVKAFGFRKGDFSQTRWRFSSRRG